MNQSVIGISLPPILAFLLFGLAGCNDSLKTTEKQNTEKLVEETRYSSSPFAEHLDVTVFADASAYRPGDLFRIAVVIVIEEGWHIYGNPLGPGIGLPTVISMELPEGFSSVPTRYAPAEKQTQDFGDASGTWVWEHTRKVIHFLSGTIRPATSFGNYRAKVLVSAQVCKKMGSCIPGDVVVPLELTVTESDNGIVEINEEIFKDFDKAVAQAEGT